MGRHGRGGEEADEDSNGDGEPEVHGLGIESSLIRIAPFVWSNGGDLVDDDENPTHFTLDTPEAQVAMSGSSSFTRDRQGHAGRGGGRVRGRRDPVPERPHGDGALVSPRDPDLPDDSGLRLGRRRAAAAQAAGRHPPLRRVLPDEGVGEQGRGLELHGVRARSGRCPIVAKSGRTVPSLKSVAESDRVPRPHGEACELAGLPRHDPGDPAGAEHLDVAGDRGRDRADPRGGVLRR